MLEKTKQARPLVMGATQANLLGCYNLLYDGKGKGITHAHWPLEDPGEPTAFECRADDVIAGYRITPVLVFWT
jgi:hypothetical protein